MTDAHERDAFAAALRGAVEDHAGEAASLDTVLEALGWHDALVADPRLAISVLFESQGAANATSSALGHVMGAGLGTGFVLPALGTWDPPGTLADGRFRVRGMGTASSTAPDRVVVPTAIDDTVLLVPTARAALTLTAVRGLDPALALVTVDLDAHDQGLGSTALSGSWPDAVRLSRLAVGHELVGAAGAMLELARVHALERVQFGRPVAAFQAVRHRLADTLVAIEGARALLETSWDDGSADATAMAKAAAGRAARSAARHCQQVLAGMGFTTEHPLHRYVRRVLVLDELFGSARVLTLALGQALAAGAALPPPIPL